MKRRRIGPGFTIILAAALTPLPGGIPASGEPKYLSRDVIETPGGRITVYPVNHASFVITAGKKTVYTDPVGGVKLYKKFPKADLVLITHIHFDHLSGETLAGIKKRGTVIIGTKTVSEKQGGVRIMKNGESLRVAGIPIEAVPAYNTTGERKKFHPRGRDNGYIVALLGKRIYISGDTEDIPEMRRLKNIDAAFLCMNLPYTMTVEQAASALLEFRPKTVYPYHYRGGSGMSDIEKLRELVKKDRNIRVKFLKWY